MFSTDELQHLINRMKHPDWRVREQAVGEFLRISDEELIKPLSSIVKREPFIIRSYFCQLLGELRRDSCLPHLVFFLRDENEMVRDAAAVALDRMEGDDKYDLLLVELEEGNVFSKSYAAETLGKDGQMYAVFPLIHALSDSNVEVRLKVIEALRMLRDVKAIKPLRSLIQDPEPRIRHAVIFTLGDLGGKEAAGDIVNLLNDPHPQVRELAAWSLGQFRMKKMGKFLASRCEEEDDGEVRCQLLRAVTASGDENLARESLEKHIKDKNYNVSALATHSLKKLGKKLNGEEADVCLLLEGTYPYFPGGVSSWIHNLVKGLPNVKFSLVHLTPFEHSLREFKFLLSPNVINLSEVYLHERSSDNGKGKKDISNDVWDGLKTFIESLSSNNLDGFGEFIDYLQEEDLRDSLDHAFLFSRRAWDFLMRTYRDRMPDDTSFVDFFWTYRSIVVSLLQLLKAYIPPAKVYHAVSTGYAGLLGVIANRITGNPLLLTEHGIYHEERKIEIASAGWVYTKENDGMWAEPTGISLKDVWINFFNTLSKLTYRYSERIITLYESNRQLQLEMGACPDKTAIIPNGIEVETFSLLKHEESDTFRVGFIGRVVPIKDVKTFIRTCRLISEKVSRTEFLLMGPVDEDPAYVEECRMLIQVLGLGDKIKLTGNVKVHDYYPKLDVLVLTSISEAQPLVIMEAMGAGVPVVATDVGSCRELLMGRSNEDMKLGPAGLIVSMGNPQEVSEAVLRIFSDGNLRNQMSEIGRKRVDLYYKQENVLKSYDELYRELA